MLAMHGLTVPSHFGISILISNWPGIIILSLVLLILYNPPTSEPLLMHGHDSAHHTRCCFTGCVWELGAHIIACVCTLNCTAVTSACAH
jgi:hypothetical protein